MNYFYSMLLGTIQGLTEFLPVSSSGHLVIVQSVIPGFSEPGIMFEVILHAGTLFAVLFYFKKKLLSYLNLNFLLLLALATLPAGVFGFLFNDAIEGMFSSVKLVGIALIITGVFNLMTDRIKAEKNKITFFDSLVIGLFQALAMVPGISRSGSTIFAGVSQKLERKKAAEFSFLLSVPAVLGANILELYRYSGAVNTNLPIYFVGFVSAFLSGILAIRIVFKFLQRKSFKVFALYCFLLGFSVLVFL